MPNYLDVDFTKFYKSQIFRDMYMSLTITFLGLFYLYSGSFPFNEIMVILSIVVFYMFSSLFTDIFSSVPRTLILMVIIFESIIEIPLIVSLMVDYITIDLFTSIYFIMILIFLLRPNIRDLSLRHDLYRKDKELSEIRTTSRLSILSGILLGLMTYVFMHSIPVNVVYGLIFLNLLLSVIARVSFIRTNW